MDFRVSGADEAIAALRAMEVEAVEASTRIVTRGQIILESAAKRQFTGAHTRGQPTNSAPGEPPDVVSGTLRRSITHDTPELSEEGLRGRVYPTAVYARIQELGGETFHGFLPPRPYMGPAREGSLHELERIAVEEWERVRPR